MFWLWYLVFLLAYLVFWLPYLVFGIVMLYLLHLVFRLWCPFRVLCLKRYASLKKVHRRRWWRWWQIWGMSECLSLITAYGTNNDIMMRRYNVTLLHQQYVSRVADEVWQTSIVFTRKQPEIFTNIQILTRKQPREIFEIFSRGSKYCDFCQLLPFQCILVMCTFDLLWNLWKEEHRGGVAPKEWTPCSRRTAEL